MPDIRTITTDTAPIAAGLTGVVSVDGQFTVELGMFLIVVAPMAALRS